MSEFKFYPSAVVWEITFACNMRCIHCGTSAGKRRPDELTTDEALKLVDELADLGSEAITISGGEPLLREDWPLLARRMKERGVKAYLITNGYAMTPEIAKTIADIGINNVGISFDGTEPTHNYIRQRPDSYSRCLGAMDMLRAAGAKYCAVTQVSNLNLHELDRIKEDLIAHGCKVWRIQMTTVTGRMKENAKSVMSIENYPLLVDKILDIKKDPRIKVDVGENIGYYGCKGTELWDGFPYFGCYAGTRIAGIESNGNVKGCLSMPEEFVEGNIRDSSFTEIWNNPNGFAYNRKFTKDTATGHCHDCKYLPLCRGGCTTTSVSASGKRAENPYCMYHIEKQKGIEPVDTEYVANVLQQVREMEAAEINKSKAV